MNEAEREQLAAGVRHEPRLGPAEHLRRREDFAGLNRGAQRAGDSLVRVKLAPNRLPYSRVAFAVSRRYGNAPARNRLRRQFRDAWRLEKARLPVGYDVLLTPPRGKGSQAGVPFAALRESLVSCVQKAARRAARKAAERTAREPEGA